MFKQPVSGLAVDASCRPNPGEMEYRAVDIKTGREIFKEGVFSLSTNNIGEFLAIVHGIQFLHEKNFYEQKVYSDSVTALYWLRFVLFQKKKGTSYMDIFHELATNRITMKENPKNKSSFDHLRWAIKWLVETNFNIDVQKWDTYHWGENLADFGYKK